MNTGPGTEYTREESGQLARAAGAHLRGCLLLAHLMASQQCPPVPHKCQKRPIIGAKETY